MPGTDTGAAAAGGGPFVVLLVGSGAYFRPFRLAGPRAYQADKWDVPG